MNNNYQPLTPSVFYILLALHQQERHGYDIMKTVERDSDGVVKMGAGTLYGAIKRLLEAGLVVETDERPDAINDDERRRYYGLTATGKKTLGSELMRLDQVVQKGHQLGVNINLTRRQI